ncbi:HD domain-containing protein [Nonomuraea composti]|uniref:HD domain-containing protein n=1 Tax=Nonomuraea composti TaxID=2720023 RepID=UPI001F0E63E9|nr:HD domain-containing protein [Nonomuraea sp. FMUSA5-5]
MARRAVRRDGSPYITHPVAVAVILAELRMDHELLCAALLHEVLEATACPEEELAAEFGPVIIGLLRAMRCGFARRTPPEWPVSMDKRLLTLKLADRLHNQRTIGGLPEARQRVNSRENLEVVAPVAARLGLPQVEEELRRLALANLSGLGGAHVSFGVVAAGAILLPPVARTRWVEEWLGELLALPGGRARLRFAFRLLAGMPRMALTLRRHAALPRGEPAAVRLLRWVVRSDLRAWALLAPLLGWLVLDAAADRLADAVVIAITVPPVLTAAIHTVRARLGDGDGDERE